MTEHAFKTRFSGHKVSLKYKSHRNDTSLSKYIWELKDKETPFTINWSIVKRAKACKGNTKRSEMISKCRHEINFMQPIRKNLRKLLN